MNNKGNESHPYSHHVGFTVLPIAVPVLLRGQIWNVNVSQGVDVL